VEETNMTRTLLIVAASFMVASAAWAIDAPSQPGGGNNVSSQFKTTPAPAPASTTLPDHNGPINAPIQQGGGNNVNAQFQSTPAPKPAPTASANASMSQAPAQQMPFNPNSYSSAADCMTAASAAHQALDQCKGLKK
jgi:hypothetical protein